MVRQIRGTPIFSRSRIIETFNLVLGVRNRLLTAEPEVTGDNVKVDAEALMRETAGMLAVALSLNR